MKATFIHIQIFQILVREEIEQLLQENERLEAALANTQKDLELTKEEKLNLEKILHQSAMALRRALRVSKMFQVSYCEQDMSVYLL